MILISNLLLNHFLEGQGTLKEKKRKKKVRSYTQLNYTQPRIQPYSKLNYKIQESNHDRAALNDNTINYFLSFPSPFIFFTSFFFHLVLQNHFISRAPERK